MFDDTRPFAPPSVDRHLAERLVEGALGSLPRYLPGHPGGQAQADLFIERSVRDVRGVSLSIDDERPHVPVLRCGVRRGAP